MNQPKNCILDEQNVQVLKFRSSFVLNFFFLFRSYYKKHINDRFVIVLYPESNG